jgi:predicted nucleic-acid-binding Zn-ribbon protein
MRCECDNCGFTAQYERLPQAQDLSMRLTVGGLYTDVECPKCGCLCFPIKPKKKVQKKR